MKFPSTRRDNVAESFSHSMRIGLALDGGLFVPERIVERDFATLPSPDDIPALAQSLLEPYFVGDELEGELEAICNAAFSFSIPVVELGRHSIIELFHGPTAAFKDVGARFLAECLSRLPGERTILVATSGDTGGAVAAAFHQKTGVKVGILYPDGGVSHRQEHQLTCWSDNVQAFAVRGSFDNCQALVKQAFWEPCWRGRGLTTANSINLGRLLPQMVYHAIAALTGHAKTGDAIDLVVPAGNCGNATAALWAKVSGLPIRHVILTTNENRTIPDFVNTGTFRPRPSIRTLASAMDIGNPSNLERLRAIYPDHEALRESVKSTAIDDDDICTTIRRVDQELGRVLDPHTATAVAALRGYDGHPKVIVSTAHAAKFEDIVEPIIGRTIEIPATLAECLERSTQRKVIFADLRQVTL